MPALLFHAVRSIHGPAIVAARTSPSSGRNTSSNDSRSCSSQDAFSFAKSVETLTTTTNRREAAPKRAREP
jgi:hypothetical protein